MTSRRDAISDFYLSHDRLKKFIFKTMTRKYRFMYQTSILKYLNLSTVYKQTLIMVFLLVFTDDLNGRVENCFVFGGSAQKTVLS